jgi:MraZ protein
LFLGKHHLSIDENNCMEIPAGFAELLAEGAILTQGFDRNLLVFTPSSFEEIALIVRRLNLADPLARALHRMLLGNAVPVQTNPAGSICLPAALKEFAGLDQNIVLIGQGDYFEIWAQPIWSQQEISLNDADANAQRYVSLDLSRSSR